MQLYVLHNFISTFYLIFRLGETSKRVTDESHFQDTRHMRFTMGTGEQGYEAGDVVNILPKNDPEYVDMVFEGRVLKSKWLFSFDKLFKYFFPKTLYKTFNSNMSYRLVA